MVLSRFDTMTPKLLAKIKELVEAGATVVGSPPCKSPSLSNYPACDLEVLSLAKELKGSLVIPEDEMPGDIVEHAHATPVAALYPDYDSTSAVLKKLGVSEDFTTTGPVRYGHRRTKDREIYFVSNKSDQSIQADCTFRVGKGEPELWHPVSGERRFLPQYERNQYESDQHGRDQHGRDKGLTTIPLEFMPRESFFVIFSLSGSLTSDRSIRPIAKSVNFPKTTTVATVEGSWEVSFDPRWGGPEKVTFDTLRDWTQREERGIRYYSGIATYRMNFNCAVGKMADSQVYLGLGKVHDMARVRLNGKELGVIWCAPWRVDISHDLNVGENQLEIEVANRWPNRLIGDQQAPDADVRTVLWPSGLLEGRKFKTGRHTFTTGRSHNSLLPSGLLGPVTLQLSN
jgi:hypothetical protein